MSLWQSEDLRARILHWIAILVVFVLPLGALLPLVPLNDGMENFNVLTATEIARDGQWAVPTMWGRPRIEKPPLTQWLSAGGILAGGPIEWAARWPGFLLTCLTLIVVYEWGRLMEGWRTGLAAAAMAGTSLFFLRFSRRAAYDGPLMFWVALTNLALTWAMLRGRWARGGILAGLVLGGGLMSKGPQAILHTLVPFTVCCVGMAIAGRGQGKRVRGVGVTVLLALVLGVAVCVPWALAVVHRMGGWDQVVAAWKDQVARGAEKEEGLYTSPANAFVFFALLLPWTVWFFGAVLVAMRRWGEQGWKITYLLVMALLPVAVHAFLPPMRERYLLPMVPAAAVLAALVFMDYARRWDRPEALDRLGLVVHWGLLVGLTVAYPIWLAAHVDRGDEPVPSLPWGWAGGFAAAGLVAVAGGMWLQRKTAGAIIGASVLAMLLFQTVYTIHQHGEPDLTIETLTWIRENWPTSKFYCLSGSMPPRELGIHLGRTVQGVKKLEEIPPGRESLVFIRKRPPGGMPEGSTEELDFVIGDEFWQIWKLP